MISALSALLQIAKWKNTQEKAELCCVHGESEEATVRREPLMLYDRILVKCLEWGLIRGCSLVAASENTFLLFVLTSHTAGHVTARGKRSR